MITVADPGIPDSPSWVWGRGAYVKRYRGNFLAETSRLAEKSAVNI